MTITSLVADKVLSFKESYARDKAISVSIEGLSNSGKSTFGRDLSENLESEGHQTLLLEGDKYHVGYTLAMEIYRRLTVSIKDGGQLPENFPSLIWRFETLKNQTLDRILEFNTSKQESAALELNGVLTDKKDGTEHDETYALDRNTIVVMPAIFLRHLEGFDYSIFLEISPETSIKRKIARAHRKRDKRDPKVTSDMVNLIEYPAMVYHNSITRPPNLTLDMNDFEATRIIHSTH